MDGVCTDDPKRFDEVREEWKVGRREVELPFGALIWAVWVWLISGLLRAVFWWRLGVKEKGWSRTVGKG